MPIVMATESIYIFRNPCASNATPAHKVIICGCGTVGGCKVITLKACQEAAVYHAKGMQAPVTMHVWQHITTLCYSYTPLPCMAMGWLSVGIFVIYARLFDGFTNNRLVHR